MTTKKTAIIDLDGTFITANSFSLFIAFIAKKALKMRCIKSFVFILWECFLRKCRVISHTQMKKAILISCCKWIKESEIDEFTDKLREKTNHKVIGMMGELRRDHYVVLATAAPEIYAKPFSKRFGFDGCIATPTPAPDNSLWKENSGEEKLANVKAWITSHNSELDTVITDDPVADKPLVDFNKDNNTIIINKYCCPVKLDKGKNVWLGC